MTMKRFIKGLASFLGLRNVLANLQHVQIPLGLSYKYGTLFGWTLHEWRHNDEMETVQFFEKHLAKTDRIADVGANIGYYTLQFATLGREVVAFEPAPTTRKRLLKAVSRIPNVTVEPYGVSSETKSITLYSRWGGDTMASTAYKVGPIETTIQLRPLKDFGAFDWVKIDVEGGELDVLDGMSPTNIVLEVAKGIVTERYGSVEAFLKKIEERGYDIYFIVAGGETVQWTGSNLFDLRDNAYIRPRQLT